MQSGVTARYALKPSALDWLASLDASLRNEKGHPFKRHIARRTGVHPQHLSKILHGTDRRLGEQFMSGLVNLAMEHGATRSEAEEELFDFLTAAEVENRVAA